MVAGATRANNNTVSSLYDLCLCAFPRPWSFLWRYLCRIRIHKQSWLLRAYMESTKE
ncbi:hypothetical protein FOCG_18083 [Fusarium oxysporum f. sp. radicis-lycopersici 26381]|nr:hypothetical protein FOCG_18083 [Fusarium oxysporum f. sp. radicis-lycopersici 26381]